MGTTYTVRIVAAPSNVDVEQVQVAIDEVLSTIDRQMSGYRPDSDVARFNASRSTDWFDVPSELAIVVASALDIGERSGGALDITVAPLVETWGFGPAGAWDSIPDAVRLELIKERIGYEKLHARTMPPALRKEVPELTVDLNAVAPGYAVDLLVDRLASLGVQHCMVDIGGEVRVHGQSRRNTSWRIAVEKPIDSTPEPYLILSLKDVAVATSGEYRHALVREGRRYSHTIDPRTAQPIAHDLASVVVVSPTALQADGWATAFNVLGPDEGQALATRMQIPALFIRWKDGALVSQGTPGFEKYVAE